MADPFEVRVRFTLQLQHLNASVATAQKASQYALKYKEMDEDLHSCILEQLERGNLNIRANIMHFIVHFLDAAQRDGQVGYVRMMERDIGRVVDAVAPRDGSGATNVAVVKKVLRAMQAKRFLPAQTVLDLEADLNSREIATDELNSPFDGDADVDNNPPSQTIPSAAAAAASSSSRQVIPRLDKRQIEQRIEEDRERHKRMREDIWAIDEEEEIQKTWEETSDMGEDDLIMAREEWEERLKCIQPCEIHETARDVMPGDGMQI